MGEQLSLGLCSWVAQSSMRGAGKQEKGGEEGSGRAKEVRGGRRREKKAGGGGEGGGEKEGGKD